MATNLYDPNAKGKKPTVPGQPIDPIDGPLPGPGMTTNPFNPKPDDPKTGPVGGTQPYDEPTYTGPAATTNGNPFAVDPKPQPQQPTPPGQGAGDYNGPAMATTTATPAAATNTAAPIAPAAQVPMTTNTAAPIAPAAQVPQTAQPAAPAYEDMGNGMARFPDGQVLPMNHPLFAQRTGQAGATPGAAAPGAAGTPAAGAASPAAPANVNDAFKNKLLELMGQSSTVSETDPSVAGQIHANEVGQQRSFERRRAMAAERAAASGGRLGDAELDTLASARGDAESAGNAGIMGQAAQQRKQEIMQALTLGGQYLSDQDKNTLTKQLAELDAQIKREGISSQTSLGQGDLALRGRLGDMQGNLSLLGLLQGNQQFNTGLSNSNAQFSAGLNQQALLHAMGLA